MHKSNNRALIPLCWEKPEIISDNYLNNAEYFSPTCADKWPNRKYNSKSNNNWQKIKYETNAIFNVENFPQIERIKTTGPSPVKLPL